MQTNVTYTSITARENVNYINLCKMQTFEQKKKACPLGILILRNSGSGLLYIKSWHIDVSGSFKVAEIKESQLVDYKQTSLQLVRALQIL